MCTVLFYRQLVHHNSIPQPPLNTPALVLLNGRAAGGLAAIDEERKCRYIYPWLIASCTESYSKLTPILQKSDVLVRTSFGARNSVKIKNTL